MVIICPLCKSKRTQRKIRLKDYSFSKDFFDIYECKNCFVGFTQPELSEKKLKTYYDDKNYHSYQKSSGLFSIIYAFVQKLNNLYKLSILKELGVKTLLDYGSGSGSFVDFCNKNNINTDGFEPINKNNKEKTYHDTQIVSNKKYDCVTLWHVLEHTKDPVSILSFVRRVLNKGGRLVIALPNTDSYDNIYYGDKWAGYDVPRHQYHFNPKSINRLISTAGLEIESNKPLFFDAFYVSILSEKNSKSLFWFIKGCVIGLWSNIRALFNKKHSSIIYIVKL